MRHFNLSFSFIAVLVVLLSGSTWSRSGFATVHSWDVQKVFVPVGYDDNDNVQVVLDGIFPDNCHVLMDPFVEYRLDEGVVAIRPRAFVDEPPCRPRDVEVSQVVDLGPLPFGDYQVVLDSGLMVDLPVAESNNAGPDDHLFAQVEHAWPHTYLDHDNQLHLRAELDGFFTNSCQSWEGISVEFDNGVYVIRPMLKEREGPCLPVLQEFTVFAEMERPEEPGRYLMHVRSMDGGSYNYVFEF